MIPFHINRPGIKPPEEGTYYIVAKNGIFLRKDTGVVVATVPIKQVSALEPVSISAKLRLPKLTCVQIIPTLLFFRSVYQKYKSEAEVQLHYNPTTNQYKIHCPVQVVSSAGVDYDSSERFEGYQLVGTIHSHCNFGAFHSGVDDNDEKHFDGLHITLGDLDQPYFTISCSIVVNGHRVQIEPEMAIIGIEKVDHKKTVLPVSRAYRRTEGVSYLDKGLGDRILDGVIDFFMPDLGDLWSGPEFSSHNNGDSNIGYITRSQFWNMATPEGTDYRNYQFPRHWMDKVNQLRIFDKLKTPAMHRASALASGMTIKPTVQKVTSTVGASAFEKD